MAPARWVRSSLPRRRLVKATDMSTAPARKRRPHPAADHNRRARRKDQASRSHKARRNLAATIMAAEVTTGVAILVVVAEADSHNPAA